MQWQGDWIGSDVPGTVGMEPEALLSIWSKQHLHSFYVTNGLAIAVNQGAQYPLLPKDPIRALALLDTVISSEMATWPKVTNEGHLFYVLGTVEPLDPAMPEGHLLVGSVRPVITVCPVLPQAAVM